MSAPADVPEPALLCPEGTPPLGWEFLGAEPTPWAYVLPCPCCQNAAVPLVPNGLPYGYRLAVEHGCGAGCPPELIAWWHSWRQGVLPQPLVEEPTPRAHAYARTVARNEIQALAAETARKDPRRAFREAAYRIGRVLEPGGLTVDGTAEALLLAARGLGLDLTEAETLAQQAVLAGMASPRELPR